MKFTSMLVRALGAAALTTLLVSCGGEELVAFQPNRILVFGDQLSVITPQGRKYGINGFDVDAPTSINCFTNPLWVQVVSTSYGLSFPECIGTITDLTPAGRIRARFGATAGGTGEDDLAQQVTRQLQLPAADGGGITSGDLVTVLIGMNDVVAAYQRLQNGASDAEVIAQAEQAGSAIAAQIARINDAGGKVIVATVMDIGLTPFGTRQDADGRAMLTYLTSRLNARLLVEIDNNGRKTGLIEINPYLIAVVGNPLGYGYGNVSERGCIPLDLLACTPDTLNPRDDGAPSTAGYWLWAGDTELAPIGHLQLGNLAATRAHNQPF